MAFHDDRFPLSIAYGSSGGPGFSTAVTELSSGRQERVARWATPLWRFNVASGIKNNEDIRALIDFYLARQGVANSFRYLDHRDYTSNEDDPSITGSVPAVNDQVIGNGDGSTTQFQLVKTYRSGSESMVRTIRKPIHNETLTFPGKASVTMNVIVAIDGVQLAETGNWSVNTTTGIITFTTAPADGTRISAGFYFDTPVYFGQEIDEAFLAAHVDYDVLSIDEIILVEDRAQYAVNEDIPYGGAIAHGTVSADLAITTEQGRVQVLTPSSAMNVLLPQIDSIPGTGGPIFMLYNSFGAASFTVQTDDGLTTVVTVSANNGALLWIGVDAGGNRYWIAT